MAVCQLWRGPLSWLAVNQLCAGPTGTRDQSEIKRMGVVWYALGQMQWVECWTADSAIHSGVGPNPSGGSYVNT